LGDILLDPSDSFGPSIERNTSWDKDSFVAVFFCAVSEDENHFPFGFMTKVDVEAGDDAHLVKLLNKAS